MYVWISKEDFWAWGATREQGERATRMAVRSSLVLLLSMSSPKKITVKREDEVCKWRATGYNAEIPLSLRHRAAVYSAATQRSHAVCPRAIPAARCTLLAFD